MIELPQRNLLADATSPYLRQHSDNPVHWRPWTRDALAEARMRDRPILLSVGYAACHWCHVMARESFSDEAVAAVMNRHFVNIKVDREERPDIDQIYMAALTAMGEQGGWPLTMFLTPDARPFWGGTYFPPVERYGRPGFVSVLEAVAKTWLERRTELQGSAETLDWHIAAQLAPASNSDTTPADELETYAGAVHSMIDPAAGGLRGAPKFPNAPMMQVLRLNWFHHAKESHRDAVVLSLRGMLSGGIYDHLGGGLCRYSTDAQWLVPHFEKMLYDNAQLIDLAGWAWAETRDELFRYRIEETISWLAREMRVSGGGLASSLDAETEGEEGLFYLWSREEIVRVLGADDAEKFLAFYELAQPSGWTGAPVLHRLSRPEAGSADIDAEIGALKAKLLEARDHRVRPGRDDKVLVDWNGLAIAALARAARQFARRDWLDIAMDAFRFVSESADGARLPHSISVGRSLFPGLSSDHAAMIAAAISLAEATGDDAFLEKARQWLATLERWHGDEDGVGHYLTAADCDDVPIRIRGDVDDAVPSATAQIIEAMTRLAVATSDHRMYERALETAEAASRRSASQRYGQAGIVHAVAIARKPKKLIVAGEADSELVSAANRFPDKARTDLVYPVSAAGEGRIELPDGTVIDTSAPGAWLCIGQTCLPPVHSKAALEALLRPRP